MTVLPHPFLERKAPTPRRALATLRSYALSPKPPPGHAAPVFEKVLYGFAQPLLGLRLLVSDPDLLREALQPALLLAAFCAVAAMLWPDQGSYWPARLKTFYKTFAALAPLPSIVFARHYARLAALVRWRLGFGPCGPREQPLPVSLKRAVQQLILVSAGAFPFWLLVRGIPFLGIRLVWIVPALWGLHWVVVDAFDDARVLHPGETLQDAEAEDRRAPSPWYVRWFLDAAARIPLAPVSRLLRRFARTSDRLSLAWRGEISIIESNQAIAAGFSISTAALLATPVLNLLFRPTILIASAHLLGHLEGADKRDTI